MRDMTAQQREIHKKAVKIRKMPDVELVAAFESPRTPEPKAEKTVGMAEKFLDWLDSMSGTGNGIGRTTVLKLRGLYEKYRKGGVA